MAAAKRRSSLNVIRLPTGSRALQQHVALRGAGVAIGRGKEAMWASMASQQSPRMASIPQRAGVQQRWVMLPAFDVLVGHDSRPWHVRHSCAHYALMCTMHMLPKLAPVFLKVQHSGREILV